MTIKQLIEALKEHDETLQVIVTSDGKDGSSPSEKLYIFNFAGAIVISGVPKGRLKTF